MKYPYTNNDNRLADVIAAIQVMGKYKFYKRSFSKWADQIEGNEDNGEYWEKIFRDHPEFFRIDQSGEKASLVLRRSYQKRYDVDRKENISKDEFYRRLEQDDIDRISRKPLNNENIDVLISTAINLHSSELSNKSDSRWWVSILVGFLGVVIGGILGLL